MTVNGFFTKINFKTIIRDKMVIVETVYDDLLNAKTRYIAQQCNCVTTKSHGLSAVIAKAFPWADAYVFRKPIKPGRNCSAIFSKPGTIEEFHHPTDDTHFSVICMYAQWGPGLPLAYSKYYPAEGHIDNAKSRLQWFKTCVAELDSKIDAQHQVGVPYMIGCGLAGGSWSEYRSILDNASTQFVIYHKTTIT
jgi:hypothetical protein